MEQMDWGTCNDSVCVNVLLCLQVFICSPNTQSIAIYTAMCVSVYSSLLILLIHSFIYEATDCNVIAHSVTHLLTLHPLSYSVSVQ